VKTPSTEDLRRAIDWLRSYEGGPGDDTADMERVAAWLEAKADERDIEEQAVTAIVAEAERIGRPVTRTAARTYYRRSGRKRKAVSS
jgi:hypothetical protein